MSQEEKGNYVIYVGLTPFQLNNITLDDAIGEAKKKAEEYPNSLIELYEKTKEGARPVLKWPLKASFAVQRI